MPAAAPSAASRRVTSPLPRTTTRGTRSGSPTSASAPACPGVGTSCTASAGTPFSLQGRRDHQLDQRRRAAQRGGTRAQHGGAAGLEHLGRDVHRHVRPGLEHRADHPDGHAPLEHPLAGGQGADEALQRRLGGVGEHLELDGHVGEALGRQAQPVEQAAGHAAALGGVDVRGVRGEQVVGRGRAAPRPSCAARRRRPGPRRRGRPGAAAAARWAAARTAACSGVSRVVGRRRRRLLVLTSARLPRRARPRSRGPRSAAVHVAGADGDRCSGARGAAATLRSDHGARGLTPAPRRRSRCRCSAGSSGRTGRRR